MYCILFTFGWMRFCFHTATPQGRHKHAMRLKVTALFFIPFFPLSQFYHNEMTEQGVGKEHTAEEMFSSGEKVRGIRSWLQLKERLCASPLHRWSLPKRSRENTRCCSASGEEQRRGQSQWFRVKEERSCLLSSSHPSHIRTQLFMWRARSMAMAGRVFKKKAGGWVFFLYIYLFFLFAKSVMWCKIKLPSALLAALFWGSHLSVIRKQDFWFSWSNIRLKKEAVWTGNWRELWVPKCERIMAAGTHASDRSDWKQAETLVTVSIWLLVYVAE